MPSHFRVTWTLAGHGWAGCTVETHDTTVELTASYISDAPGDLLTAVARLVAGESQTRAQFEAEPTVFRWIFSREGELVRLRLLELGHGRDHDNAGAELWSGALTVDGLARAVIRCFDEVAVIHGESGYSSTWGEPFPRDELEALRRIRRAHRPADRP